MGKISAKAKDQSFGKIYTQGNKPTIGYWGLADHGPYIQNDITGVLPISYVASYIQLTMFELYDVTFFVKSLSLFIKFLHYVAIIQLPIVSPEIATTTDQLQLTYFLMHLAMHYFNRLLHIWNTLRPVDLATTVHFQLPCIKTRLAISIFV